MLVARPRAASAHGFPPRVAAAVAEAGTVTTALLRPASVVCKMAAVPALDQLSLRIALVSASPASPNRHSQANRSPTAV